MSVAAQTAPNFLPWTGPLYCSPSSIRQVKGEQQPFRLFIIGESHYDAPPDGDTNFTRWVADTWRAGEINSRYLHDVAKLVRPDTLISPVTRRELDACAFYNFVQISMATRGQRPTGRHMRASAPKFPGVLQSIDPTHVLATGKSFWQWLPAFDIELLNTSLGGESVEIGKYRVPSGEALAINTWHPAAVGFSMTRWRGVVQDFLKLTP